MRSLNGCHTAHPDYYPRRAFYWAQDGRVIIESANAANMTAEPIMVRIKNVMTTDCQYSKHRDDPRCAGCEKKARKE